MTQAKPKPGDQRRRLRFDQHPGAEGPRRRAQAPGHVHRRHVRRHGPPPHGVRGARQRDRRGARRLLRRHQGRDPRRQLGVGRRQRPRHSDRRQGRRRGEALGGRDRDDRAPRRRQVRPEQLQGRRAACTASASRSSTRCRTGCKLRIWRNGKAHQMEFRRGVAVAPLAAIGTTDRRGTEVHFMASAETFGRIEYHYDILAKRIRELSFLNNGMKIELDRPARRQERELRVLGRHQGLRRVHEPQQDGAAPEDLPRDRREGRHRPSRSRCSGTTRYAENVQCFTNNIPQRDGGTHLTGLRQAMTRTLNNYIEKEEIAKKAKVETTGDDMREGPLLRAVGEGARAQVLVADQGQARLLGGAADRPGGRAARSSPSSCSRIRPTPRSSARRSSRRRGRARPRARRAS